MRKAEGGHGQAQGQTQGQMAVGWEHRLCFLNASFRNPFCCPSGTRRRVTRKCEFGNGGKTGRRRHGSDILTETNNLRRGEDNLEKIGHPIDMLKKTSGRIGKLLSRRVENGERRTAGTRSRRPPTRHPLEWKSGPTIASGRGNSRKHRPTESNPATDGEAREPRQDQLRKQPKRPVVARVTPPIGAARRCPQAIRLRRRAGRKGRKGGRTLTKPRDPQGGGQQSGKHRNRMSWHQTPWQAGNMEYES